MGGVTGHAWQLLQSLRGPGCRHVTAVLLLAGLVGLFTLGRAGMHPVHLWNRAFADASFVLLCLTLTIGPTVRLAPRLSPLLAWRRQLGILASVAAIIHVAIYAEGAYHWNLLWFVVEKHHGEIVFSRSGFALANWVGAVALLYAVVLALTANDFAQHLLGRGWKLLQQQSYTLYVLTVLHAVVFTYVRLAPGVFTYALWGGIIVTVGMQVVGYIWTLVHQGRSPLGGDEVVRRGVRASLPCRSRHHW